MEVTKTILVPPVWVVAQVGKLVLLDRSCAKKGVYIDISCTNKDLNGNLLHLMKMIRRG